MEVEKVLYGDPPTDSDIQSAISTNDKLPAPKILHKALPRRQVGLQPSRRLGDSPGALTGVPGLLNNPLCNFVPIPVTVSVPVALSPLVSVPVRVSVPVSVVVLVPVLPPLCLARAGTCWVTRSSGLAIWRWFWGRSPIGWCTRSRTVEEGLCHGADMDMSTAAQPVDDCKSEQSALRTHALRGEEMGAK
ncbi:hypothetical protein P4O66_011770, partial [Electrophorus voltai]